MTLKKSNKRINNLTKAYIIASLFLGVLLVLFSISWWLFPQIYDLGHQNLVLETQIENPEDQNNFTREQAPTSTNYLLIPKIGVEMQIFTTNDQDEALEKGAWHLVDSGSPDGSADYNNIIIGGHRFKYLSGSNTFYNLDKLEENDLITIYWAGLVYNYLVNKIYVVTPEQVEIFDNTDEQRLTLFTCNPVFSTNERLVIEATPLN